MSLLSSVKYFWLSLFFVICSLGLIPVQASDDSYTFSKAQEQALASNLKVGSFLVQMTRRKLSFEKMQTAYKLKDSSIKKYKDFLLSKKFMDIKDSKSIYLFKNPHSNWAFNPQGPFMKKAASITLNNIVNRIGDDKSGFAPDEPYRYLNVLKLYPSKYRRFKKELDAVFSKYLAESNENMKETKLNKKEKQITVWATVLISSLDSDEDKEEHIAFGKVRDF